MLHYQRYKCGIPEGGCQKWHDGKRQLDEALPRGGHASLPLCCQTGISHLPQLFHDFTEFPPRTAFSYPTLFPPQERVYNISLQGRRTPPPGTARQIPLFSVCAKWHKRCFHLRPETADSFLSSIISILPRYRLYPIRLKKIPVI